MIQTELNKKGKSFRWVGEWKENEHYFNTEFAQDFCRIEGAVVVCKASHFSTQENKPKIVFDEQGNEIGIERNAYWEIAILPNTDFIISGDNIPDGIITTNKLADKAVTKNKLADNSVTTHRIVNLNVTTEKIANEAITKDKIAKQAVTISRIADGAIITPKIANEAVTEQKLSEEVQNKLNSSLKPVILNNSTQKINIADVETNSLNYFYDNYVVKVPLKYYVNSPSWAPNYFVMIFSQFYNQGLDDLHYNDYILYFDKSGNRVEKDETGKNDIKFETLLGEYIKGLDNTEIDDAIN